MYWLIALLGVALAVAPFVLGYSDETTAMWTSVILGAAVALIAGFKAAAHDTHRWEDWLAILAGVLAIIAPFVLFNTVTTAVWTSVVAGVLIILLAGYRMLIPSA
ncbi:MAG: SPW repeat protein [Chloroflexota bacterium]